MHHRPNHSLFDLPAAGRNTKKDIPRPDAFKQDATRSPGQEPQPHSGAATPPLLTRASMVSGWMAGEDRINADVCIRQRSNLELLPHVPAKLAI
jgi:hypothetical protein